MAYDQDADKVVADIGEFSFSQSQGKATLLIRVRIMSYKGGDNKISLTRDYVERDGKVHATTKLGRITKVEVDQLIPLLTEAQAWLETNKK